MGESPNFSFFRTFALGVALSFFSIHASQAVESATTTSNYPFNYNVSVNPLGFVFGTYNLDFELAVGDHLTVGPAVQFASVGASGVSVTGAGGGVNLMYYFTAPRLSGGWYLSPELGYISVSASDRYSTISVSLGGVYAETTLGYHWFNSSGFNCQLGLGARYIGLGASANVNGRTDSLPGVLHGMNIIGDLRIGYAF